MCMRRIGFYLAIFVGLLLVGVAVWFSLKLVEMGLVGDTGLLIGLIVGGLINAGTSILVGKLTSGRDEVRIVVPDNYRIEIQASIKE